MWLFLLFQRIVRLQVNNAGVFASHTVETVTLECFDKIFAVNVRAPLQLTQLLAPHLIKVKGNKPFRKYYLPMGR